MNKKATALVLAILLMIMPVGCGNKDAGSNQGSGNTSEKATAENTKDNLKESDAIELVESDDVKDTVNGVTKDLADIEEDENEEADSVNDGDAEDSGRKDRKVNVSEIVSKDGKIKNQFDQKITYSYHIPHIDDDTDGADQINKEINDVYVKMVDSNLLMIQKKEEPDYNEIVYQCYSYDNVLSIVMNLGCYYAGYTEYRVFNYDTAKGKWMQNDDVFKAYGITGEKFVKAARYTAANVYDTSYLPIVSDWDSYEEAIKVFNHERNATLSSKNITDEMPVYIDDEGQLNAIFRYASMAGADYRYVPDLVAFPPEKTKTVTASFSGTLGDVEAVYKNGKLYLEFISTEAGDAFFEYNMMDPDEVLDNKYTVHGCYKDVRELKFMTMAGKFWPYLFIITDDGFLEMVDIEYGTYGEYFCVMGPFIGAVDVKSITAGKNKDYTEIAVANCGNGRKVDLYEAYYSETGYFDPYCYGNFACDDVVYTDGGGSYDVRYELHIDRDSHQISYKDSVPNVGVEFNSSGSLSYMGLSEEGEIYYIFLFDDEGGFMEGPIAMNYETIVSMENGYEDYNQVLSITELNEDGFITGEQGKTTYFDVIYGNG